MKNLDGLYHHQQDKVRGYQKRPHRERKSEADRDAAVELVRELAGLVCWYREGKPLQGTPKCLHGARADKALVRADAFLAGSGAEAARRELLNGLAVVSLLKLARGRMQHIVETTAAAMTHAESRMTKDLIAQIDAAFADAPAAPKAEEEGE